MSKKASAHGHDTRYVRLQKNYCFACGKHNPEGMRLKFAYDEDRDCFVSRFRLGKRYTGPPGHTHGGIIATILDEAMGKVNKLRHVVALTSQITVDYLKPVPLNKPLRVESREVRSEERRVGREFRCRGWKQHGTREQWPEVLRAHNTANI